ncbi:MAG: helix-turn-helix transcriptional regulator [Dehalococcoidia bacterium]|nr:helix-turn-helix transcriptional regulator [Dehalococcoidia bacterium]
MMYQDEPGRALSAAEEQVLEFLADDLTNAEIAERLVCSPETVKTHVSHILSKLGLANRRERARWWREKITRGG